LTRPGAAPDVRQSFSGTTSLHARNPRGRIKRIDDEHKRLLAAQAILTERLNRKQRPQDPS
jgi:hypothetical protein